MKQRKKKNYDVCVSLVLQKTPVVRVKAHNKKEAEEKAINKALFNADDERETGGWSDPLLHEIVRIDIVKE